RRRSGVGGRLSWLDRPAAEAWSPGPTRQSARVSIPDSPPRHAQSLTRQPRTAAPDRSAVAALSDLAAGAVGIALCRRRGLRCERRAAGCAGVDAAWVDGLVQQGGR